MAKFSKTTSKVLFDRFEYCMKHHPIKSNSLLSLALWISGDVLAQILETKLLLNKSNSRNDNLVDEGGRETVSEEANTTATTTTASSPSSSMSIGSNNDIDFARTLRCAGYGAIVTGPLLAVWYPFLDGLCKKHILPVNNSSIWLAPVCKVVVDELIMEPPCIASFFGYMNLCEGGDYNAFVHKMQSEFMTTWLASISVWPAITLGMFRFCPVHTHAPIINACCVLWDAFLSHRNNNATKTTIENT